MPRRWNTIKVKRISGQAPITEEQKNAVISKAESMWRNMGLTDKEIAFGIATMGVESGFDSKSKGTSVTEKGLGQFNDGTWDQAVVLYNKKFNVHLMPDSIRQDHDAQLAVMGVWIPKVWDRADKLWVTPGFQDHSHTDIAYGLWHTGAGASTVQLQDFFSKPDFKNNRPYLNDTYEEAHAIQTDPWRELRGVPLMPSHNLDPAAHSFLKGLSQGVTIRPELGDTLRREGNKVWRIDGGNGKTHGYFVSE